MGAESAVVFASSDPAEAEAFLARAYATVFVGAYPRPPHRFSIDRAAYGPLDFARVGLSCAVDWQTNPLGKIRLSCVHQGVVRQHLRDGSTVSYGPGDVMIMGEPDQPFSGRCERPHFDVALLDPSLLQRVATSGPARRPRPVRLTGSYPLSLPARDHLAHVIGHLHTLARSQPLRPGYPLLVSTAADHLAALLLTYFPNTAVTEPTIEDRHDTTSVLLQRAITYIDDHAHTDISLADIAGAIYVTPRALQLMFRRHLDCTPMQYLRRVRLHHAHSELINSTPGQATVTAVAYRWGFGNVGRFAAYYRQTYGHSPRATLRAE